MPLTSPPAGAQLLRIAFTANATPGLPAASAQCATGLIATFRHPRTCAAEAVACAPDDLPDIGRDAVNELHILFLPAGAGTPYDQQRHGEDWMAKPDDPALPPTLELLIRGDRILWRPGRALILGSPERFFEHVAALVDFSFHEAELRALEAGIERDWPVYEDDISLTHQVNDIDLEMRQHVNLMTLAATRRRMTYARLERPLEKPSVSLPPAARRLVGELCVQSEILERMKSVDDSIEVYEDLYELANDRLSDYQYFRSEFNIEVWILVVLAFELLFVAWELVLVLREN